MLEESQYVRNMLHVLTKLIKFTVADGSTYANFNTCLQINKYKYIGIDWRERRLISKLYIEQKVKVQLDLGETRSVQIGRGVR